MALSVFEDGFYNSEDFSVSCSEAVCFGNCFAKSGNNIAVGMSENTEPVFYAIVSGLLSTGKNVWNCGMCTKAELRHAIELSDADYGVYLDYSCGNIKITATTEYGFPISRDEEDKIIRAMQSENRKKCCFGKISDMTSLHEIYKSGIKRKFTSDDNYKDIQMHSSSPEIQRLFNEISGVKDSDFSTDVSFHISDDGTGASAYSCESGFVFRDKLILICCIDEFQNGNDVFLPESFPAVAEIAACRFGKTLHRFDPLSEDVRNMEMKKHSLRQTFLYDGIALTRRIIEIMNWRHKTLAELNNEIPHFTTTIRYVSLNELTQTAADKIRKNSENNICLTNDSGRITVKKTKSGKSLMFYAESYSTESADEFCSNFFRSNGIT